MNKGQMAKAILFKLGFSPERIEPLLDEVAVHIALEEIDWQLDQKNIDQVSDERKKKFNDTPIVSQLFSLANAVRDYRKSVGGRPLTDEEVQKLTAEHIHKT